MDDTSRYFNNSEIETFKECRRKWYLAYYLKQEENEEVLEGNLAIGTAVHAILNAHYTDAEMPNWQARLWDKKDIELVEIMIEGYHQWLEETGIDAGLTPVASEGQITAEIGEIRGRQVFLTGRLDLLVRTPDGRLYLFDHKTSAAVDRTIGDMAMSTQLLRYALILKMNGVEIAGVLYNILRKVKRTPKAKPPFYLREIAHYSDTQLRNIHQQTVGIMEEILRAEERLAAGENPQVVCPPTFDYSRCSWKCPFFALCPTMDHVTDMTKLILPSEWHTKETVDISRSPVLPF